VALLLTYLNKPEQFKAQTPLADELKLLSTDELIALIMKLINKHPGDRKLIERMTATKKKPSKGQSFDIKAMRETLREALGEYIDQDEYGDYDYYDERREYADDIDDDNLPDTADTLKLLEDFVQQASQWAEKKTWANVSAIGRMLLEELDAFPAAIQALEEYEGFTSILGEIVLLLSKALDQLRQDMKERRLLQNALLEVELGELDLPDGVEFGLEILPTILKSAQDDDIQGIRKRIETAIQNNPTYAMGWYAGRNEYYEQLLAEIDQFEGLDLSKTIERLRKHGAYSALVRILLEQGRMADAIQVLEQDVAESPNTLLLFLNELEKRKASPEAMQVAERVLKKRYDRDIAGWLLERRENRGDREGEFQLRLEMLKHKPNLKDYQGLRETAKDMGNWDALRPTALEELVKNGSSPVVIQACMDDQDWATAWKMLRRIQAIKDSPSLHSSKYWELDLAAHSLFFTPDEAIPVYMRRVYEEIQRKNRAGYQEAVGYLKTLHEFYVKDQNEAVFKKIIQQIRAEFPSLRALEEELKMAKF
jgi:uncharacterized Zn finger protein